LFSSLKASNSMETAIRASNILVRRLSETAVRNVRNLTNHPKVQPLTKAEVVDRIFKHLGASQIFSPGDKTRELLSQYVPRDQKALPMRRMQDTYTEIVIPLGSSVTTRDQYITHGGNVRFGRNLADLDAFAAYLGLQHLYLPDLPPNAPIPIDVVTALVDSIDLGSRRLSPTSDVNVSGYISWVGKSSLECTLKIKQLHENTWEEMLSSKFVMVARDPVGIGAVAVNGLDLQTEEEKAIFQEGERNKERRKRTDAASLLKTVPSPEEMQLIHNQFLQTVDPSAYVFKARIKPEGHEWMDTMKLKNLLICHPQHRNRYNKIFGGFLMRQAFELGWALAFVQSKSRPQLMNVDDIWFRKPVEIGSMLYLQAQVVYGGGDYYMIRVSAEVMDPITGASDTSNIFFFHFKFTDKTNAPFVTPRTYSDAMLYLDGKRHYEAVTED